MRIYLLILIAYVVIGFIIYIFSRIENPNEESVSFGLFFPIWILVWIVKHSIKTIDLIKDYFNK